MFNLRSRQDGQRIQSPRLEIVARLPAKPRMAPPILFVHGAWHGAWCWEDNFLDYFASLGFACYAVNLRGRGASRGARDVRFCRIRHFVEDVRDAVAEIGADPILVGHSLGGFVVQKYLEQASAPLGVLMASIPPDGAGRMLKRLMKSQPLDLLVANLIFSLRPLFSTPAKVRKSLFTPSTPDDIVNRCAARLQNDTIIGFLDYLFRDLVDVSKINSKMLVVGAADDAMIDAGDVQVTGRAYGVEPVMVPQIGHDLMINSNWRQAAEAVAKGIDKHLLANPAFEARIGRVA